MLENIVAFVKYYFPQSKTDFYDDYFIKACLVYKFLCFNFLNKNMDVNNIIHWLSVYRHSCKSKSSVLANHKIFTLAFREFWKYYKMGRGYVYVIDTPFKECETLGLLTGVVYWFFHKGVV